MANTYAINLIKTGPSAISPQLGRIEKWLRRGAFIALAILTIAGIATAGAFFYFQNQEQTLAGQRTALAADISTYQARESLVVVVKNRLATIGKYIGLQRSYGNLFERLSQIALPPTITSITVDEKDNVLLNLNADSLDEALSLVGSLTSPAMQDLVQSPQLTSFGLDQKGKVTMGISFVAGL